MKQSKFNAETGKYEWVFMGKCRANRTTEEIDTHARRTDGGNQSRSIMASIKIRKQEYLNNL